MECFKTEDEHYKVMIYYVDDYQTALSDKKFDKDAFMIKIIPKVLDMPRINVDLVPDVPQISVISDRAYLGIIYDQDLDDHIQKMTYARAAIQQIKGLFHTHFPGVLRG